MTNEIIEVNLYANTDPPSDITIDNFQGKCLVRWLDWVSKLQDYVGVIQFCHSFAQFFNQQK